MATKTERFAVRLTAEQSTLIRRATEVEGTDLANFTVTATLARALEVLANRRLFVLDAEAWSKFVSVLDRPVSLKPRLARLFRGALNLRRMSGYSAPRPVIDGDETSVS